MPSFLDQPLDEYLRGDTHVRLVCSVLGKSCGHRVVMLSRELAAKVPGAVTVGDFKRRLRCSNCGARGWVDIAPAGRG